MNELKSISSFRGARWGKVALSPGVLSELPWHGVSDSRAVVWGRSAGHLRQDASSVASPTEEGLRHRSAKMARLEAALFVADGAVSARRLVQVATLAEPSEARELVELLNQAYDAAGSAFRIEHVARGYQMLTRPEYAFWLDKLHRRPASQKLSPPAIETLAIVAYRQPITRADIESIRGVQCTDMLKQLMDRGLVRIGGEEDTLGRPFLYETTRKFLELFGLGCLDDLPLSERLRAPRPNQASDEEEPDDLEGEGDEEGESADTTEAGHSAGSPTEPESLTDSIDDASPCSDLESAA